MNKRGSSAMELTSRAAKTATPDLVPLWKLAYLTVAEKEGRRILNDDQYAHVVSLFDDLATEENPRVSLSQDVDQVEDFYELRDKGGILGNINVRVYFSVDDQYKTIVVLACDKKEQEGQIAVHMKKRVKNRAKRAREILLTLATKPERN